MTRITLLALVLLGPLSAGAAAAQEAAAGPNALRRGAWSLSFGIPSGAPFGGGAGLGFWRMLSDRTNLGVALDLEYDYSESEAPAGDQAVEELRTGLGLEAKRYLVTTRAVAPFLHARAGAGYFRSDRTFPQTANASRGWSVDAGAGVGLEWFPARSVSVAGSTGVGISRDRSRVPAGAEGEESRSTYFTAGTVTSGLGFQIYF
jgi:hypothetical protein